MKKYLVKAEVSANTKIALVERAQLEKRSLMKQIAHILESYLKES